MRPLSSADKKMLYDVTQGGDLAQLKRVLAEGADPNALFGEEQKTALMITVKKAWLDKRSFVEALLEAGADPNIADVYGMTPLHEVSVYGWDEKSAALLLRYKADINVQNEQGNTPLHLAVLPGMTSFIGLLLKSGADISIKNNAGQTALEAALFKPGADSYYIEPIEAVFAPYVKEQREKQQAKQLTEQRREILRQKAKPGFRLQK